MKIVLAAVLALAVAGSAGASPPGANVSLVFSQWVGALERGDTAPHQYLCAAFPNGTNQHKVTPLDGDAWDPAVSPLGSEIAFVSARAAPQGTLERVPAGGGDAVAIAGNLTAAWPAWSSDGSRVFFAGTGTANLGADLDLYSVPREGGPPVRFVGGPLREAMPATGGGWVVFVRSDPTQPTVSPGQLWLASEDGSTPRRLNVDDAMDPDLSADGKRIVYAAPDGIRILTLEPAGSRIGPVLPEGVEPQFSPDGTRIAYVAGGDVWTMGLDGSEQVNVTHSRIPERGPSWRPAGAPAGAVEPCALVGTKGDDVVTGSPFRDIVYDGAGNDVYRTLEGDDIIDDGEGSDGYVAGDGADVIHLLQGANTADGGAGSDWIISGASADRLLGGDGNDLLTGGRGRDYLAGERGTDQLRGGPGNDVLAGGRGQDDLDGERDRDLLLARDHTRDRVEGGAGFDRARLDRIDRRNGIERLER